MLICVNALLSLQMVKQNPAFDPTRSSNSISKLHLDILNGDDERIEPRDFLPCTYPLQYPYSFVHFISTAALLTLPLSCS